MLKIGEFSRLSQVTVKTLHHYDDLGLLKPAHIDEFTSYRYYTLEQLPRVHRIMALKELGLSLEQIGLMLSEEVAVEQIREMLHSRQSEIQQHLLEEQRRLSLVDFRLRMIEAEINFPELDVVIKRIEPLNVLAMLVGRDHEMGVVSREIQQAITAGHIKFAGKSIDIIRGDEINQEIHPRDAHHEILLAVEDDQPGDVQLESQGILILRTLPAVETAATLMIHGGEQDQRHEKVMLLQRWAVAHGYTLLSQIRALHHRGPLETLDRSEWVTEIQLALAPAN